MRSTYQYVNHQLSGNGNTNDCGFNGPSINQMSRSPQNRSINYPQHSSPNSHNLSQSYSQRILSNSYNQPNNVESGFKIMDSVKTQGDKI